MNPAAIRVATAELDIHCLRAGAGPPLVLLHGWPEFSRVWRKNIPALAAGFDVLAPDLRGFGDTSRRDGRAVERSDPDLLATDLAALLDALGLERVGIVSHDIGAYVAQAFARRWPARVSGLFFFDCPYPGIGRRWGEAGHLPETWYQYFHQWPLAEELVGHSRATCRLYFGHFLRHWSADPNAFDEDLEAWVDNFLKPGNLAGGFAWYRGVLAMRQQLIRDGAPKLAPIAAPTRVLWGARDPVLPAAWSDRLPDYFSDLRLDLAPGAGHFVHYETPDLANTEMLAFFRALHTSVI